MPIDDSQIDWTINEGSLYANGDGSHKSIRHNHSASAAPDGSASFSVGYWYGSLWQWGARVWRCYGDGQWDELLRNPSGAADGKLLGHASGAPAWVDVPRSCQTIIYSSATGYVDSAITGVSSHGGSGPALGVSGYTITNTFGSTIYVICTAQLSLYKQTTGLTTGELQIRRSGIPLAYTREVLYDWATSQTNTQGLSLAWSGTLTTSENLFLGLTRIAGSPWLGFIGARINVVAF